MDSQNNINPFNFRVMRVIMKDMNEASPCKVFIWTCPARLFIGRGYRWTRGGQSVCSVTMLFKKKLSNPYVSCARPLSSPYLNIYLQLHRTSDAIQYMQVQRRIAPVNRFPFECGLREQCSAGIEISLVRQNRRYRINSNRKDTIRCDLSEIYQNGSK